MSKAEFLKVLETSEKNWQTIKVALECWKIDMNKRIDDENYSKSFIEQQLKITERLLLALDKKEKEGNK